jgi:CubicO group peptidase (beta-lactamase class C family)
MDRHTRCGVRYLLIVSFLFILSSCHVARYVYWNYADINDYKKFPADTLKTAPPSFHFRERNDPVKLTLPEEFRTKCDTCSLDGFLVSHKTVAFLVIRNDSLVYEKYFKGYSREAMFPSFSVSKSYVSALTGIAIDEGYIKSIGQPVTDFIPELKSNGFDKVTLKDLLEMRSGIDFKENYSNPFGIMAKYYYGLNIKKYTRKIKVVTEPGKVYNYQSANAQIMAMVIERATGKKISEYLEEKIWKPLGMEYSGSWNLDSKKDDEVKAYCCINGRAVDFAKFGRLYLNNGQWENKAVIPSNWVRESLTVSNDSKDSQGYPYTYFWRVTKEKDFFAKGILGQYIYVSPGKNTVIVRIGEKGGDLKWPDLFREIVKEL